MTADYEDIVYSRWGHPRPVRTVRLHLPGSDTEPFELHTRCPQCSAVDVHYIGDFTTVDNRSIDCRGRIVKVVSGCREQKMINRICRICSHEWRQLWPWPCVDPPPGPGEVRACIPPRLAVMVDDMDIRILHGDPVNPRIDAVVRGEDGLKVIVGAPSPSPVKPRCMATDAHLAYVHMLPYAHVVTDACIDRRPA